MKFVTKVCLEILKMSSGIKISITKTRLDERSFKIREKFTAKNK